MFLTEQQCTRKDSNNIQLLQTLCNVASDISHRWLQIHLVAVKNFPTYRSKFYEWSLHIYLKQWILVPNQFATFFHDSRSTTSSGMISADKWWSQQSTPFCKYLRLQFRCELYYMSKINSVMREITDIEGIHAFSWYSLIPTFDSVPINFDTNDDLLGFWT